jgi:hypothetical protein
MAEQRHEEWWRSRQKNATVTGTWEEDAFQISLRHSEVAEDPLNVPTYCEVFPYHCIPHCGVYGFDDYFVALPMVTIQLSSPSLLYRKALFKTLPSSLRNAVNNKAVSGPNALDVFITVHPCPDFKSAVEPDKRELNLLYHPWVFREVGYMPEVNQHAVVEMGVFSPYNVAEVAEVVSEDTELLNGMAVNRMEERIVEVHGGMFSPRNAQVCLTAQTSVHAFYSCGWSSENRMAIVYHVMTSSEDIDKKLLEAVKSSNRIGELLAKFDKVSDQYVSLRPPLQEMNSLLYNNGKD